MSKDQLFQLSTSQKSSWGTGKFRISNAAIVNEMNRLNLPNKDKLVVMEQSYVLVSDYTMNELIPLIVTDKDISLDEARQQVIAYAVGQHLEDMLHTNHSPQQKANSPNVNTIEPDEKVVLDAFYTASKDDPRDADETVLDLDVDIELTQEQLEFISNALGTDKEMRTRQSVADMARSMKLSPNKFVYFALDTFSKTGKNSMRKGIRPKFLDIDAGEAMPTEEVFKEFYDMFILVPRGNFDKNKYTVPISNKAVYTSAMTLKLPLFWFQLKILNTYLIIRNKKALVEFLSNHTEFTNILDDYEFPDEMKYCIALFNAIHVDKKLHIADAISVAGNAPVKTSNVVNPGDSERAEFYKTALESMRAAINKGKGKDVIDCYKQLIEFMILQDSYEFLPPLTERLKEANLNGKTEI